MMRPPSSSDPAALPDPAVFERQCRAFALLDAILCPEWEYRTHSFNGAWDPAAGMRLGSMRDGAGDEWFAVFQPEGVFLRGFAHEAPLRNAPGLFDGVPEALAPLVTEPAFGEDATFCFWNTGDGWRRGAQALPAGGDPDGSAGLLALFTQGPDGPDPVRWKRWAEEIHERSVPIRAIQRVFAGEPLDAALLREIDPERTLDDLAEDLEEMGWPVTVEDDS